MLEPRSQRFSGPFLYLSGRRLVFPGATGVYRVYQDGKPTLEISPPPAAQNRFFSVCDKKSYTCDILC